MKISQHCKAMSKIRLQHYLLFSALLCLPLSASAQTGPTSEGTDFWIGMMPNYLAPAQMITIFVTSGTANTVHCDFYGGSETPVDARTAYVKADSFCTFYQTSTALAEERTPERPEYKAIHVYARSPIIVTAMTHSPMTTDSYLALPAHGLGTEYIASCYYDDMYSGIADPLAGEFLIVAPYDSTHVHIGPVRAPTRSDSTGKLSHDRGSSWDVTLQRGQTYLVQSTGLGIGDDDLTGTPITSDKPISFISGHQRASMPIHATNESKDHLCEMYPPVDEWGTEYYDMPMAGRTIVGDYIRLIAGDDNVRIRENGRIIAQLSKKGDFVDREKVTEPVIYQSVDNSGSGTWKKFLAVQFAYSAGESGDPGPGDPFAIALPPKEQFQKRMLFRVPDTPPGTAYTSHITFITRTDSVDKLVLNGRPISSYPLVGRVQISTTNMSAIRVRGLSTVGPYLAECGAPFGAYLYGYSDEDSYGHPVSMGLRTMSADTMAPTESHMTACGRFDLRVSDVSIPRMAYSGISDISMIADSGDWRWSTPSYNYSLSFTRPLMAGDTVASATLTPIDLTKDAYAALWVTDRAGNDTIFQYRYQAPIVRLAPQNLPVRYGQVLLGADSCRSITLTNLSNAQLTIDTVSLTRGARFTFSGITRDTLLAGDSIRFDVCFRPTDSLLTRDTLIVATPCLSYVIPLEGRGAKEPVNAVSDPDGGSTSMFRINSTTADDISATSLAQFHGTIKITDILGRRYSIRTVSVPKGERISIALDDLSAGVYIITIRSEAGNVQALKIARK